MKRLSLFAIAGLAAALSIPAHATSAPDSMVNGINSSARPNSQSNGPTASPQLGGGGGGTGDPIGGICTGSPENATIVLALLSIGGLLAGRRITRVRLAHTTAANAQ